MVTFMMLVAVRALVLLGVAWGAMVGLRRRSAALRAGLWTAAFVALIALPMLSALPATLTVPVPSRLAARATTTTMAPAPSVNRPGSRTAAAAGVVLRRADPVRSTRTKATPVSQSEASVVRPAFHLAWPLSLGAMLLAIWIAGSLLVLSRVVRAHVRLAHVVHDAKYDADADAMWSARLAAAGTALGALAPRVRLTELVSVPAVAGLRRPVLLLPVDAPEWTDEAQRVVVLHEVAHVARHDIISQLLGQLACALFWYLPVVWLAVRQAAALREQATDDLVLASGVRASSYAASLIDLARRSSLAGDLMAAVAMASPTHLRRRVVAILDASADRRGLARVRLVGLTAVAVVSATVLAATAPVTRDAPVAPAGFLSSSFQTTWPALASVPLEPVEPVPAPTPVPASTSEAQATRPAPPAPPASPAPPAPPAPPARSSGSAFCGPDTSSSSDSDNERNGWRTWEMHITARGCEMDLRAEGKIEFNADFTDIAHLPPGGSFHVTVLRASVRHELTLTERNGSLERTWRIDGHDHAYDAEAQRWLADFLVEVDRQTAMGVDYRLPALLKQGGVAAVLKETALMSADYPRSVYYRKLAETTKLYER